MRNSEALNRGSTSLAVDDNITTPQCVTWYFNLFEPIGKSGSDPIGWVGNMGNSC